MLSEKKNLFGVFFLLIAGTCLLAVEKPVSLQDTCVTAECHVDFAKKPYVHGPVGLGDCRSCHEPHSSDHDALLGLEPKKLCLSCHVVTAEELEKFEFVHEPARCSAPPATTRTTTPWEIF